MLNFLNNLRSDWCNNDPNFCIMHHVLNSMRMKHLKKSCFLQKKILITCYPPSVAFIHQDWIRSVLVLKGRIIVITYPRVLVVETSGFNRKILCRATDVKLYNITTMSILKRSICELNRLSYDLICDITIPNS